MRILLIRHGQTDENAQRILQGHTDTHLNATGRRQAEAVAARLSAAGAPRIDLLISSDLARAAETAAPLASSLGLEARLDARWRERAFGAFEGRTLDEADVWRAAAGAQDLPGAEPADAFRRRVRDALEDVAWMVSAIAEPARPAPATVAVVTHGGPIRAVLTLLADGVLTRSAGVQAPALVAIINGSILHLDVNTHDASGFAWGPIVVNDAAHLPVEWQSQPEPV